MKTMDYTGHISRVMVVNMKVLQAGHMFHSAIFLFICCMHFNYCLFTLPLAQGYL